MVGGEAMHACHIGPPHTVLLAQSLPLWPCFEGRELRYIYVLRYKCNDEMKAIPHRYTFSSSRENRIFTRPRRIARVRFGV